MEKRTSSVTARSRAPLLTNNQKLQSYLSPKPLSTSVIPPKPQRDFKQSNISTQSKPSINQTVNTKQPNYGLNQSNPKTSTDILELIKRRLDAIKIIQIKSAFLEVNFYVELFHLESRYNQLNKPLKDLRKKIINGEHEPTDEQCKVTHFINNNGDNNLNRIILDEIEKERETNRDLLAMTISGYNGKKGSYIKGIPEFWLTVLKRVGLISQMIESYDEPILKHLYDIDVDLQDTKPYYFTLKFYFSPNEYFTDGVLIKTYEFKIEIDSTNPYVFEGPETKSSRGCKINWKKGKNVTKKSIFLEESNSDQYERQTSFFNFFDTIDIEDKDRNCLTCDEEAELRIDYEIGYTFKEKVIPRAILYYMGEITDESDDDDVDDEDDDQSDKYQDDEQDWNDKQENYLNKNLNKN